MRPATIRTRRRATRREVDDREDIVRTHTLSMKGERFGVVMLPTDKLYSNYNAMPPPMNYMQPSGQAWQSTQQQRHTFGYHRGATSYQQQLAQQQQMQMGDARM